jgi:16S rRNA processing protein RimM
VSELILVGVITGAKGIQGELRIKAFTAKPDDLFSYGPLSNEAGNQSYKGRITGHAKDQLIARFKGCDSRTKADELKGVKLYIQRDALPEPDDDEYYYSDLEGLKAELIDGSEFGIIRSVLDAGAGASLEIETPNGEILVPFTKDAVPVVDMTKGLVVIDPPDGLMEPPSPEETSENGNE